MIGDSRTICGPRYTFSTWRYDPATVTFRTPSLVCTLTRWYSPDGIIHDRARTTMTSPITTTRVWGMVRRESIGFGIGVSGGHKGRPYESGIPIRGAAPS